MFNFDKKGLGFLIESSAEKAIRKVLKELPIFNQEEKLLYTKEEASNLLSVSKTTLDRLVVRGELKMIKANTKVLFYKDHLKEWIENKMKN